MLFGYARVCLFPMIAAAPHIVVVTSLLPAPGIAQFMRVVW